MVIQEDWKHYCITGQFETANIILSKYFTTKQWRDGYFSGGTNGDAEWGVSVWFTKTFQVHGIGRHKVLDPMD